MVLGTYMVVTLAPLSACGLVEVLACKDGYQLWLLLQKVCVCNRLNEMAKPLWKIMQSC